MKNMPNEWKYEKICLKKIKHIFLSSSNDTLKNEFLLNKDCMEFLSSYNVNGNKTLIIKCSPKVRNLLKNSGDVIKIGHKLCRLYDRHHVYQCSKCCCYGHTIKHCKKDSFCCTFCGEGHSYEQCKIKDNKSLHKCFNCLNSSADNNENAHTHNAFYSQCPVKLFFFNKMVLHTDTGHNIKINRHNWKYFTAIYVQ